MKSFISTIIATVLLVALTSGCTRVETGHVGVRVAFNGQIEPAELGVGFHQTFIGNVRTYVANEITLQLNDLHPQTKDRTTLSDLDLAFTYSIAPNAIADLVVRYKGRDMEAAHGDIYPLGLYVTNVVQTATTDVFARYDALTANENREKIVEEVKVRVSQLLEQEKLSSQVRLHQIFIKNLDIAQELKSSVLQVIKAQNELTAKSFEVSTARKEAERLVLLSTNKGNIDYMNAKSLSDIAEGVKNGKVQTMVIPYNFNGILSLK